MADQVECDSCGSESDLDPIIDPIYGKFHGWQCQGCTERAFERSLEGPGLAEEERQRMIKAQELK